MRGGVTIGTRGRALLVFYWCGLRYIVADAARLVGHVGIVGRKVFTLI